MGSPQPVMGGAQESDRKTSGVFSSDLAKLADLSLSGGGGSKSDAPTAKRMTKKDFARSGSNSSGLNAPADPNDPLSQLDPLWSLK